MGLKQPALIVICGWPASGKTTTAKLVQTALNEEVDDLLNPRVHLADIDEIRHACIGLPHPKPNESEELTKKDGMEMGRAYHVLLENVGWHLAQMRSLIICATFSGKIGQQNLLSAYNSHFNERMAEKKEPCALHVIQCVPIGDTNERVARLFAERGFGAGGYVGGVNSPERYFEVKNRYQKILIPHIEINTWEENTPEECARQVLTHILS